ncbi:hypothetical protein BLN97_17665 [Bradyrhizobium elkanii]|nr:hypothetical protein BLN97_17665 [Bradyrhizobium elkanii]
MGAFQRVLVNVTGVSAQRSSSKASTVASGIRKARRRFRVFFGRHQMPLFSRCPGPIRIRSLPRWQVITPSFIIRTRSVVACLLTNSITHAGHGTWPRSGISRSFTFSKGLIFARPSGIAQSQMVVPTESIWLAMTGVSFMESRAVWTVSGVRSRSATVPQCSSKRRICTS